MAKPSKSRLGDQLIVAAADRDVEAMQRAIDDGADVNFRLRSDNNSTVLGYAAYEVFAKRMSPTSLLRVLTHLIENGFDPNLKNRDGTAGLAEVIELDVNGATTNLLVNHDAEPKITDKKGWTPLMVAAHAGCLQATKHLLPPGANSTPKTTTAIRRCSSRCYSGRRRSSGC